MIIKMYNNYKSACMHKLDKLIQTKVFNTLNRYRVYIDVIIPQLKISFKFNFQEQSTNEQLLKQILLISENTIIRRSCLWQY